MRRPRRRGDQQRAGADLVHRCEAGTQFSLICDFHLQDLPPDGTTRLLYGNSRWW
jgi:hypothetical protein